MFGKKKVEAPNTVVDAVCTVCGSKCFDQVGLERHMAWAHKASQSTAAPEKKA